MSSNQITFSGASTSFPLSLIFQIDFLYIGVTYTKLKLQLQSPENNKCSPPQLFFIFACLGSTY